jgi:hypothetical protein
MKALCTTMQEDTRRLAYRERVMRVGCMKIIKGISKELV